MVNAPLNKITCKHNLWTSANKYKHLFIYRTSQIDSKQVNNSDVHERAIQDLEMWQF